MNDEARATGGLDPAMIGAPPRRSRWGRRSPYGYPRHDGGAGRDRACGSDLCRARSRHQQLPAAGRAPDRRQLPRHRRVLPHHPARARASRRSGRISDAAIARAVEALAICRDKMRNRGVTPRAADRDRSLPRRRERRRIPRPHRRGGRARARNHRPRDRGAAGRHRLHAADRSAGRRRDPVRHRRRLLGAGPARPLAADAARSAAAGDQGLGVAAGRRGHARRAPRRARGHARDLRGDDRGGRRATSTASSPSTAARRSIASICSAPRAR